MIAQSVLNPEQVLDLIRVLYGTLTAIIFLFGSELLTRYFKSDLQTRTDAAHLVFLTIAGSVVGYGFYMLVAFANYGLIYGVNKSEGTTALQLLLVLIILVPMSLISERIVFRKNNSVISTVIGMLIVNYTIILTILEFVDGTLDTWFLFVPIIISFIILGAIGLTGFFIIFFVRLSPQKEITRRIALGFLVGAIGVFGSIWAVTGRADNSMSYVYGTILEIIGWLGFRYFILSIPSYSEFEWRNGMNELYLIIANSGITLYHQAFKERVGSTTSPDGGVPDATIVGGGMIGISAILAEISKSDKTVESISMGDKFFNFVEGKRLLCVLITEKKLGVYYSLLTRLVEEIERNNPQLKNFNGDISFYRPKVQQSLQNIFGIAPPKEGDKK